MNVQHLDDILRDVTSVAGVRGALIVSIDDGLVVAESAMDDLATADVAALAASLVSRVARAFARMGQPSPQVLHLAATGGALLAAGSTSVLWLVAITAPGAELGRLRLVMGDSAAGLA